MRSLSKPKRREKVPPRDTETLRELRELGYTL
jgi:hypothetical protein